MFHNMQKKSTIKDQKQTSASAAVFDQKIVEDTSLTSDTTIIQTKSTNKPINKKESEKMNTPQSKDNQAQGNQPNENRVDIPGNNFNRANPAAAAQGSRPAYPGSYPGAAAAPVSAPASYNPQAASEADSRKLVIGQGISLSGEIEACDHLIVEGQVEAALKGASNMDISETGAFYGTVEIEAATIAGRFEGDITVSGRLTVLATGSIIGSVTYKELSIEAGASIEGSVTPLNSTNTARSGKKAPKAKSSKVSQDNSAELPFSEKVAS
jgi:cytoskeletal protein CcmA (bactofilin family)